MHLFMHRILPVLLIVMGGACGGSSGTQGPPGPPADRSKMYCRSAADGLNMSTGSATVSVTCDSETDMPWSGGCRGEDVPPGVYLSVDQPTNWDELSKKAGWTCTWAASGAPPNLNFGGHAEMCCYKLGAGQ